jgi:Leucine-rich repeat (LRR) protein
MPLATFSNQQHSVANEMSEKERQERRDRLVAKGILRDGGKSIEQYDVEDISDRDLQALTPSDLRALRRVSLIGVGDKGLACLRQASCLSWLGYEGLHIGDEGLKAIGQLRGLRHLLLDIQDQRVEDRSISASGLKHLGNLSCLTELQLYGHGITDDGVKELARLKQLRSLDIASPLIGDHALQYVATLPNLEELTYSAGEFYGSGLANLANHPRLRKLTLDGLRFKGHGLSKLSGIKSLRILNLRGYATISDTTVAELMPLAQVTHLSFRGIGARSCGDKTFSAIGKLHQLESLSIGNCTITDDGVAQLRGCTHLQELILSGNFADLSDKGVQSIASFESLRKLLVDKGANGITDAGLHHLTRLKHLEWLALDSNQVTDGGIREMTRLCNLRYLVIDGTRVTDAGRDVAKRLSQRQYAAEN